MKHRSASKLALIIVLSLSLCYALYNYKTFFVIYNNALWYLFLRYEHSPDVLFDCRIFDDNVAFLLVGKDIKSLSFCKKFIGYSYVVLKNTSVEDIKDICHADMEGLKIVNSPVRDLAPLNICNKLSTLSLERTNVNDLSPLKGMQLYRLSLYNMNIENIDAVESMPLRVLVIGNCPIRNIEAVKTCNNLATIQLDKTHISSIYPLSALKELNSIVIKNCPISSIDGFRRNEYSQVTFESTNLPNEKDAEKKLIAPPEKRKIIEF